VVPVTAVAGFVDETAAVIELESNVPQSVELSWNVNLTLKGDDGSD
jgi:hypothetical protein